VVDFGFSSTPANPHDPEHRSARRRAVTKLQQSPTRLQIATGWLMRETRGLSPREFGHRSLNDPQAATNKTCTGVGDDSEFWSM
jgi:hypothetical protein